MESIKCIYGCNRNMKCVNVVEDTKIRNNTTIDGVTKDRYTKYFVCNWCKGKLTRKGVAL